MEDETFCPITHERFVDPVVCSDGHTYESAAIARCLAMGLPSPSSNLKGVTIVAPNWMARKTVERTYAIELPPSKHARQAATDDLLDACETLDWDRVRVLIAAGTDVNTADEDGWTSLHYACRDGRTEIVSVLIGAGVDVNAKSRYGWTSLCCASYGGHAEVVKILIQAGVNVNAADEDGETPLHDASYHGHAEVVKILIQAGADVHAKNEDGKTPLSIASGNGGRTEIAEILKNAARE